MYSPSPIIIFHCNKSIECLLWKRTLLELLPCHVPHYFFLQPFKLFVLGRGKAGGRAGAFGGGEIMFMVLKIIFVFYFLGVILGMLPLDIRTSKKSISIGF